MFDEEMRDRMRQMQMEGQLEELIEKLIERMQQEDYISYRPAARFPPNDRALAAGWRCTAAGEV